MTALVATEYSAQIVWLGVITQRKSVELQTEARSFIKIDWNGVLGSAHSGRTRFSDVRVSQQHDKGTEISNVRQLSIVSQEDIEQISAGMCMAQFDPSWLGANLVVSGLPDSHICHHRRVSNQLMAQHLLSTCKTSHVTRLARLST
jgi:MOSC domain-containing protein YiiM